MSSVKPYRFGPVSYAESAAMVAQFHYSHDLPNVVRRNYGAFDQNDKLHAVACYGPCVSRKVPSDWIELRRLVKRPGSDLILSQFLSATIREIKRERGIPAILSWADPEQDHHGGIYQATNWIYTEQKAGGNRTFIDENGKHIHPRTVYSMFGTQSVPAVLALRPTWTAFLPKTKHRYLMPIRLKERECMEILHTKRMPYPKPDMAINPPAEGGDKDSND